MRQALIRKKTAPVKPKRTVCTHDDQVCVSEVVKRLITKFERNESERASKRSESNNVCPVLRTLSNNKPEAFDTPPRCDGDADVYGVVDADVGGVVDGIGASNASGIAEEQHYFNNCLSPFLATHAGDDAGLGPCRSSMSDDQGRIVSNGLVSS